MHLGDNLANSSRVTFTLHFSSASVLYGLCSVGEAVVVSRFIELIYRDIHKELSATYSIVGAEFLSWIANYPSDIDVK
jgi:hypothetical protein